MRTTPSVTGSSGSHHLDVFKGVYGLHDPWEITDVSVCDTDKIVRVHVALRTDAPTECPECGVACVGYDHRRREWRHLDSCEYTTLLVADLPRVRCPEHGVVTVKVPWAESYSRFTAKFEVME